MRIQGKWLFATAVAVALLVSPFAIAAGEGDPILGGARNPSSNQTQELTRETEIIASTSSYGTRQSNKSDDGGGAIYGCRSGAGGSARGNEPCIRANNLAAGRAFEFESESTEAGRIEVGRGGDGVRPFSTNATGVATGLNADRVDGLGAQELQRAQPFAQVRSNGTAVTTRGLASATGVSRQGVGDYDIAFAGNLEACAINAALYSDAGGEVSFQVGAPAGNATTVDVRTFDSAGTPRDQTFHVSAVC